MDNYYGLAFLVTRYTFSLQHDDLLFSLARFNSDHSYVIEDWCTQHELSTVIVIMYYVPVKNAITCHTRFRILAYKVSITEYL